jgi:diguanylate cyclase (GGDEF)-like protein/PAS domain S-box-containing protein
MQPLQNNPESRMLTGNAPAISAANVYGEQATTFDSNAGREWKKNPWLFLVISEAVLFSFFWFAPSFNAPLAPSEILAVRSQFSILASIAMAASFFLLTATTILYRKPAKKQTPLPAKLLLITCSLFPLGWSIGILFSSMSPVLVGSLSMLVIGLVVSIALFLSQNPKSFVTALLSISAGIGIGFNNAGYWIIFGVCTALIGAWMPIYLKHNAALKNQNERLSLSMNRASAILTDFENSGNAWFWETDRHNRITYLSERTAKVLGREIQTLVGEPVTTLINAAQQKGENQERTLSFHLTTRAPFNELNVQVATDDEDRWWSISGRPIFDKYHNFQGFRGSGTDLTEIRKSQAEVSRLAHFDSLTGLSNRLHMQTTLERILAAPNQANRICSLMLLDLDRFKEVNDTLGHPAGDALLRQVSQRLQQIIGNAGHVGRLGGDEFQLILPAKDSKAQLGPLAEQIIQTISQPYILDGSAVTIGVSIGIAVAPLDGVTNEALVRNADLALYAAKGRGRGVHHFYAPDLHSDAEDRRQLEADLRDALTNNGLEVVYQPIVATKSEKIVGVEALLRWNHPTRGFVSPSKFIPIAEDTGIITQIGEWILRTACNEVAKWPGDIRVAVNVSPIQFANPGLIGVIANTLAACGLSPDRLELEITESVFLNDDANTDTTFQRLKGLGVRLALDDFGTGYSSLGYLKKAPFDKIKIDQSFVRGATQQGSRNGAIIRSIVSLAEALNMDTTAEGVETHDELELIRALGCSHVQGYIYSKPIGAEDVVFMLQNASSEVKASGHNTSREVRKKMLRVVSLIHNKHRYEARIRDLSANGVLIEGLSNVPEGTEFLIDIGDGMMTRAQCRWSKGNRMGLALKDQISTVAHAEAQGDVRHAPFRTAPKAANG